LTDELTEKTIRITTTKRRKTMTTTDRGLGLEFAQLMKAKELPRPCPRDVPG